jgi:threonine dehydrogenase-like Zn-dependent dehydrogenase
VLKSTYHGRASIDVSRIVVDEITVVGSRCGPMVPALDLLVEGSVDVMPQVEHTYGLADALEAFDHARRRGARKILLAP